MAAKTPKQVLEELYSVNRVAARPSYQTVRVGGEDHAPLFSCTVEGPPLPTVGGHVIPGPTAESQSSNKKRAQHMAAAAVVEQLRSVEGLTWPDETLPPAGFY